MSHLAYVYGPQKVVEWVARTPGTEPFYASRFREVFGRPLDEEWNAWIAAEVTFQTANLERLRQNPITETKPLTSRALGSVSRPALDRATNSVYLGVNYPGQVAHLARLDLATGEIEKVFDLKGVALFWVTSLALDPAGRKLFYVTDNNNYRDLNVLDLSSGETTKLQVDSRVGDLAWDATRRTVWGVRHYNGISTLVRFSPPWRQWDQVHSFEYGNDLYSIDVSPDGAKLVGAMTRVDGTQELALFDVAKLLGGDAAYEVLGEFENSSPADFTFSPDGAHIYGSSFYSGVSNLYRYRFSDGEIEPLTNTDGGLFRPLPLDDSTLFALAYTAEGFQPVTLPIQPVPSIKSIDFFGTVLTEKRPELREWNIGSPAEIDLAARTKYDGDFTLLGSTYLSSMYPIVEGYKDSAAAGLRLDFRDLFSLSQLKLTLSYSPDSELESEEKLHALAEFRYLDWELHASYNRADFYDLFGPVKTGRKGYALGVDWGTSLIEDLPNRSLDVSLGAAGYADTDTLPGFQNVASPVDELVEAEAGLHYKAVRSSLGSIETEEGVDIQLTLGDQLVKGEHFPYGGAELALGTGLPIDHSSLWLRTAIGGAFGDRNSPFGNVYFGGFRNNYVDHLDYRRYRELLAFPGFEIDEITAHNFGKAMLEWNLPPIRPRAGSRRANVNWIGASLFGGVLASDIDHQRLRREYTTAGIQVDTRFTVLTHLQFTLSLGAAYGEENHGESVDEYMFSLKLPPL
jgi:hypothetical protein